MTDFRRFPPDVGGIKNDVVCHSTGWLGDGNDAPHLVTHSQVVDLETDLSYHSGQVSAEDKDVFTAATVFTGISLVSPEATYEGQVWSLNPNYRKSA